jgi:hypothetical protein
MISSIKKSNGWYLLGLSTSLFLLDILQIGLFGNRFIEWSRIGYVLMLFLSPLAVIPLLASVYTAMMAFIMQGQMVDELALASLVAITAALLSSRTLDTVFVKCLIAALLLLLFMLGAQIVLFVGGGVQNWTVFQIIANIIIVSGIMKYTS